MSADHALFEKPITEPPGDVIAIMFGYNEQDIVVSTILNALKQGMHVYYVDDYSNDATRSAVVRQFKNNDCVGYCMLDTTYRASQGEKSWQLKKQLEFKTHLARTMFVDYEWLLHMDCDEVYECPWAINVAQGLMSLPETVGKVNCEVRDYFPSSTDAVVWQYDVEKNEPMLDITPVLTVFRKRNENNTYYRFLRNTDALDLDVGHAAKTRPDVVHTCNMIMHHYPYRSKELAERKVAHDRLPRISVNDTQVGIGWHYTLLKKIELPVDMSTANRDLVVIDGRYTTYYLMRDKVQ